MDEKRFAFEDKLTKWQVLIALVALFIGTWFGPLQALDYMGINLYKVLAPGIKSYYQGLTLHAVLNALVWTTFFITGFFSFVVPRSLKRNLALPKLNLAGFIIQTLGLIITAAPLLLNLATVLYTFYPPLKADPLFYIGLTLVVVGSWVQGWGFMVTYYRWRKEHPNTRSPFLAFGAVLTMVMWQIATLGVAAEILGLILPWVFGLVDGILHRFQADAPALVGQ